MSPHLDAGTRLNLPRLHRGGCRLVAAMLKAQEYSMSPNSHLAKIRIIGCQDSLEGSTQEGGIHELWTAVGSCAVCLAVLSQEIKWRLLNG